MPDAFMRSNQRSSSGGSHWPWIGRSTAAFIAKALSQSTAAPRSVALGVPVVITMCLTPSSSTAARATSASCSGVLWAMVRPAASDWPIAQNWQVLRAALRSGCRSAARWWPARRAPCSTAILRIGHAVEGLQRVEARLPRKGDLGRRRCRRARSRCGPSASGAAHEEGDSKARRGVDRHHHGAAVDGEALWSDGPAPPRRLCDAGPGVSQPHAEGLQLVDQALRRHAPGQPCRWPCVDEALRRCGWSRCAHGRGSGRAWLRSAWRSHGRGAGGRRWSRLSSSGRA